MKKRNLILAMVVVALALLGAASIALAKASSYDKITGDSYALVEEWGGIEIWNTFSVKVDLIKGVPKGKITVKITSPYQEGVRYYETTPVCVNFYTGEDGTPWAIVVHRISDEGVSGFDPGLPGEYAKWKIHDSQVPPGQSDASNSDAIFLAYECYDPNWKNTCDTDRDGQGDFPYSEFWPADGEPPSCDDTDFNVIPISLDEGNVVIH